MSPKPIIAHSSIHTYWGILQRSPNQTF